MMPVSLESVDQAFESAPSLRKRVHAAVEFDPAQRELFDDISQFVLSERLRFVNHVDGQNLNGVSAPPTKKRKLEDHEARAGPGKLVLEARDISFSLPQRKKLHLGFLEHDAAGQKSYSVQLRNPGTNEVEGIFPLSSYAYALRLPIPEKNQKQYNFCLLPSSSKSEVTEPIIWTVNHGPLKSLKIESDELRKVATGPDDVLENALNFVLRAAGLSLIVPSEKEFASALRESHRKADVAYHVKAFRGSKEGYLFFLENGVFFGFKKPLSFFPFHEIESVSYTSVLARTFNLNLTFRTNDDTESQEIEFSMLDQQDFAGIDAYIKKHQLQDSSLAEARRAKKIGKAAKVAEADAAGDDDGRTELEKAQAELEDEEDEMEEDYDPDDDDNGSGSESESGEEEYTAGKGRNLIAEELGSEAEDVSASEEEEEEEAGEDDDGDDDAEEEIDEVQAEPVTIPTRAVKHDPRLPDFDDEDQL